MPRWFTSSDEISKPSSERVGLARVLRANSGSKSTIVKGVLIRISSTIAIFLVRDMRRVVLQHEGLVSRFALSSASDYVTSAFGAVKKGVRLSGQPPKLQSKFLLGRGHDHVVLHVHGFARAVSLRLHEFTNCRTTLVIDSASKCE